jgi:hypothetical protein
LTVGEKWVTKLFYRGNQFFGGMYCLSSCPEDGGNIFFHNVGKYPLTLHCHNPEDHAQYDVMWRLKTHHNFVFVGMELASDYNVLVVTQQKSVRSVDAL